MKTRSLPRVAGIPLGPFPALSLCLSGLLVTALGLLAPASAQGWKSPGRRSATVERAVPPLDPYRPEKGGVYSNLGLVDRLTRDAVEQLADSLRLEAGTELTVMASVWHEANWFVGSLLAEALTRRGCIVTTGDWGTPPDTTRRAPARPNQQPSQPQRAQPFAGGGSAFDPPEPDTTGAYADSVAIAEGREPSRPREPVEPEEEEEAEPPPEDIPPTPVPEEAVAATPAARTVYPEGRVLDLRVLEFGVAYPNVGRKLLLGPLRFSRVGGVFLQVQSLQGPEGGFQRMVSAERHRVDRLTGAQRHLVEGASYPFSPPALTAPSLARYIEPAVVVGIVSSLLYLFYANQN